MTPNPDRFRFTINLFSVLVIFVATEHGAVCMLLVDCVSSFGLNPILQKIPCNLAVDEVSVF